MTNVAHDSKTTRETSFQDSGLPLSQLALVEQVKQVLLNPTTIWQNIKSDPVSIGDMYTRYICILAAVPFVCLFIGASLIGYSLYGTTWRMPFFGGLISYAIEYALALGMVYVVALIVQKLASSFEGRIDLRDSVKFVGYAFTPAYVAGLLNILPGLVIIGALLSAYSIYLFYQGIEPMTGVPATRKGQFFGATILTAMVAGIIVHSAAQAFRPTPSLDFKIGGKEIDFKQLEKGLQDLEKLMPK